MQYEPELKDDEVWKYPVHHVCDVLKISRPTLDRFIRLGQIDAKYWSGIVGIKEKKLIKFLEKQDELFDVRYAAYYLNIPESSVRNLIHKDQIKYVKIYKSNKYKIIKSSLDSYLKNKEKNKI